MKHSIDRYISKLPSLNLENQRVLLRVDLNVPLSEQGYIMDDYRLQMILPTLNMLIEKKATIVLLTHLGRPKNKEAHLSTEILIPWFINRGYSIEFCPTIEIAYAKSQETPDKILLLENLRFFPGEKEQSPTFAQELATLGDYYINDAFANLHRTDTSITLTAEQFAPAKKTFGLLVEKELQKLSLFNNYKNKIAIVGGGKVRDKLPYLNKLLDNISTLILCPALVFTFLKTLGKETGISLVDSTALLQCTDIFVKAKKLGKKIILPLDYVVALDSINGPLLIVDSDAIPENALGISIGPKTLDLFAHEIKQCDALFYNAAMGFASRQETFAETQGLLREISTCNAYSIIGGGDSVAQAHKIQINNNDHLFLSTGGGSTLAFLSGHEMPGLKALTHFMQTA